MSRNPNDEFNIKALSSKQQYSGTKIGKENRPTSATDEQAGKEVGLSACVRRRT